VKYWLLAILLLKGNFAHADSLSERLASFSGLKELHGNFSEIWTSSYLKTPLVSKGRLSYSAPGNFRKLIEFPESIEQIIKENRLYITRDSETEIVQLSDQGNVATGIYALRDVLEGNESGLKARFSLKYSEANADWVLELVPRVKQTAEMITLKGKNNRINRIHILYQNGDSLLTKISHKN